MKARTAFAALGLMAACAVVGASERAAIGASEPRAVGAAEPAGAVRDALSVQQARTDNAKRTQRDQRFYTRAFDLSALPDYVPEVQASGTLRIWGNDVLTRGRLLEYLEQGFAKAQPGVKLAFRLTTSAAAIPALLTGVADIGIGRHIMFMEQLGYQRTHGHDPLEIEALNGAYDKLGWNPAWVIVVNASNPLDRVTVKQLDGIFGAERNGGWVGTTWHPEVARGPEGNVRTWGQLGLGGAWKNRPIDVYSMPFQYDPSSTFCRLVIGGSDKWNERLVQYPQYARADGSLAIGAEELVHDIAKNPAAIGWSALGYLLPGTKALAIAEHEGGPYVAPTLEAVQDRSYYFRNTNYFYVDRVPGRPLAPMVREFMRYVLSRQGQEAVVRDGKILPLPLSTVLAERAKLD